jgi:hypothetical protein
MLGNTIAILGLLVSMVAAFMSVRHNNRAERVQRLRDERDERERRRRVQEDERREHLQQASRISSSVEYDRHIAFVSVTNGSSQPIRNVSVILGDTPVQPAEVRRQSPGASRRFYLPTEFEGDETCLLLEFTDVAGRIWRRTYSGMLMERVSEPDAPVAWGPLVEPLVESFNQVYGFEETEINPPPPPSVESRPPMPPVGQAAQPSFWWHILLVLSCVGAVAATSYLLAQVL